MIPSASHRSTSTAIASIDFCQSASSGLARLIRYECVRHRVDDPGLRRAERNASACASVKAGAVPPVVVLGEELDGLEGDRVGRPDGPVAAAAIDM